MRYCLIEVISSASSRSFVSYRTHRGSDETPSVSPHLSTLLHTSNRENEGDIGSYLCPAKAELQSICTGERSSMYEAHRLRWA